jgi:hypothetical protein
VGEIQFKFELALLMQENNWVAINWSKSFALSAVGEYNSMHLIVCNPTQINEKNKTKLCN